MDFWRVIKKRKMIRAYQAQNVSDELVWKLLEAAHTAPSAGHTQVQEFIVVRDPEMKNRLGEAALEQMFVAEAPVVLVVCSNMERSVWRYGTRGQQFYSIVDGAFASLLILLACVDLGLSACFVGAFDDAAVSRVLGLPKHVRPVGIIPVGYPGERPGRLRRLQLKGLVHVDRW